MATYHNKQVVTYSIVFQQPPIEVMDLMRTIDKSTVAKIIARMNHLARSKVISSIDEVLNMWFGTSNADFRTDVRGKILRGYAKLGVPIVTLNIISVWTNLNIMDILLSESENELVKKSGDESERDFFMIYLSINEKFGQGSNAMAAQLAPLKPQWLKWKTRAMMTTLIKYHDFVNVAPREIFAAQFIKAYYCFQFLLASGQHKILDLFLHAYGVKSWQDYFRLILPLCQRPMLKGDGSGLYYFQLQDSKDFIQRNQFIRQLSLSGTESYMVKPDFAHVRSRPLYETEPGRFLVCDSVLNINRIHSSMFFELNLLATANQDLHSRYDNFPSFYTDEFIEKYLAYSLLDDVYQKSDYYRLSGDEIKKMFGIVQEPDYYVRDERKVFLFEIKGSMLLGSAKQSFDFDIVEAELKKKFYKKPGKDINTGVLQLVDRIRLLLPNSGNVAYDRGAHPKNLEIYPLLLITDRALCTPGMNMLFNEWFFEAIEQDSYLSRKRTQIHPLTIIDVDTLINFTDIFKSRPAIIEESLNDYHKFLESCLKKANHIPDPAEKEIQKNLAMSSFPDYLNTVFHFQLSTMFLKIGKSLIKKDEK